MDAAPRFTVAAVEPYERLVWRRMPFRSDAVTLTAAPQAFGVHPIALPVAIDQGPNRGRKVVDLRDADGVTIEFIEAQTG